MNLNNFIWKNGTESNPVPLSKAQIDKLVNLKKTLENAIIEGHVRFQDSIPLYDSYVNSVKEILPNLTIYGTRREDTLIVSINKNSISEGNTSIISISLASGAAVNFTYNVNHVITNKSQEANEDDIKSSISITSNNNSITIKSNSPTNNYSWTNKITVTITANGKSQNVTCIITAKGITGINLTAPESLDAESTYNFRVSPVPSDSTKLSSNYTIRFSCDKGNINSITGAYIAPNTSGIATITASLTAFNGLTYLETSKTINVGKSVSSFIRITQSEHKKDSTTVISGNIGENNEVLNSIKEEIEFYAVRLINGMFTMVQLSSQDRTRYKDGTDATSIINDPNTEVYTKLPTFFVKVNHEEEEEIPTKIKITFTQDSSKVDSSWLRWDTNMLIGTYPTSRDTEGRIPYSRNNVDINMWEVKYDSSYIANKNNLVYFKDFGCLEYDYYRLLLSLLWADTGSVTYRSIVNDSYTLAVKTGLTNKFANVNNYSRQNGNFFGIENIFKYALAAINFSVNNGYLCYTKNNNTIIFHPIPKSGGYHANALAFGSQLSIGTVASSANDNCTYNSWRSGAQSELYNLGNFECECLQINDWTSSKPDYDYKFRLTYKLNNNNHEIKNRF